MVLMKSPACVIVKHANPCGVALGDDISSAYERAFITDPTSAFGGIIAFNRSLTAELAAHIVERQFVEVIIAPEIEAGAREALSAKPNVRALRTGPLNGPTLEGHDFKRVGGGLLVQDRDQGLIAQEDLKFVTARQPTESEINDLLFAWKVVKFVKSNAIVYCKDGMTVGVGAGQMSRVYSAKIAPSKLLMRTYKSKARCSHQMLFSIPRRRRPGCAGGCDGSHSTWRVDAR